MNRRSSKPSQDGISELDVSSANVIGRGLKQNRRVGLRTLRVALGKTQAQIAEAAKMDQGDVSKLEARGDMKLSTLARYAAALGGVPEVAIVIEGRRYVLDV